MVPHGHYCVPICYDGQTLGIINIYLREGHQRSQQEEQFLMAVTNTLAGIIKRKRLAEELVISERLAAIEALRHCNGNQTQAAHVLGINRVTVWNRMKKYGIDLKKILQVQE